MADVYHRYAEALRDGHRFAAAGRFKEALRCYEAAADAARERALPHVAVGGMLLRLGRTRDALAAYERALEREPDDWDALSGRAAALLAAGRRAEAAQLKARLNGDPGAGGSAAPGGPTTIMPAPERMHAAGESARAAGKTDAAIDAWLAESAAHRAAGHHDAALDACLRALALDTSAARTHLEIALAWLARGWTEQANGRIRLLGRLLVLQPDDQVHAALTALVAQNAAAGENARPR
jgi:tetratricopeptide (TPR) repeat protein